VDDLAVSAKPAAGRHRGQWPALGLAECRGSPSPSYPVGRDRIRHRVRRNDTPEALAAVPSFRAGHSAPVSTRAPACAPVRYGPRGSEVIPQICGRRSIRGTRSGDFDQAGCSCPWGIDRTVHPPRRLHRTAIGVSGSILDEGHAHVGPAERKSRSAETNRLEIEGGPRRANPRTRAGSSSPVGVAARRRGRRLRRPSAYSRPLSRRWSITRRSVSSSGTRGR
jgi:hypothetical protein